MLFMWIELKMDNASCLLLLGSTGLPRLAGGYSGFIDSDLVPFVERSRDLDLSGLADEILYCTAPDDDDAAACDGGSNRP